MSVLDTRILPNGAIRRRRRQPDGTVVITMEVPQAVLSQFGQAAVCRAMGAWKRGQDARARAALLRQQVLARPDWKPTALAHEFGCTEQRVRQLRGKHGL